MPSEQPQDSVLSSQERAAAQARAQAALDARGEESTGKGLSDNTKGPRTDDPFLRPANEDDDGYDPYSDRPIKTSPYEEDPWR